jgi:adenylyl cyclase-associated protein
MNALFSQINQGEGVTSGLRKVDKSEMTHKNPDLRASNVVPAKSSARPQFGSSAAKAPAAVKPPKTQLEGSKWVIENHVDTTVSIEITEIKQIVLVANCTNTTVQVKGKFNAIIVDSCKKSGVVIDSAISAVEVINVKSCQVQILGSTPTITVSKSDSLQVYLSEECLNTEVFSSMSVGTLILVPTKVDGQDDFSEKPVPEQFKTTIVNGKLVTVAVDAD